MRQIREFANERYRFRRDEPFPARRASRQTKRDVLSFSIENYHELLEPDG